MNFYFSPLLVVFACSVVTAEVPAANPDLVLIDDFNDGVQNAASGYRNAFQRLPSSARTNRSGRVFRGVGGKSLRIEANKTADGFCGAWIHLFDMEARPRRFFDSRSFEVLSFWVKGETGGEAFDIRVADRKWVDKEDSVSLGSIDRFLPAGVSNQWQEVQVPLGQHSGFDRRELGGLTFSFTRSGQQTVYIDDISFKRSLHLPVPRTNLLPQPARQRAEYPRTMWVWESAPLLKDEAARADLFRFCRRHRVSRLWMQLLYDIKTDAARNKLCFIRHPGAWRTLLREAHAAGIAIHALDGYPEFCQREWHYVPLAVVDAVIRFNHRGETSQRFDGVHFDNEPYLIVGWQDPARRERILAEFLKLNAECQRRVDAEPEMEFGVDIPFWWQARDEETGQPIGNVTFNGKRQPASFHLLEMLDNVGIMNYRDSADGADGMIRHGRDLVEFGDHHGKATVYMGVETFGAESVTSWYVVGLERANFRRVLSQQDSKLAGLSRLNGHRLQAFDDGRRVHIGVEMTDGDGEAAVRRSVLSVADQFGDAAIERSVRLQRSIREAIDKHPSRSEYQEQPIRDDSSQRSWQGFTARNRMLSKITFADDSREDFAAETTAAEDYFSRYSSYGGLAIHYYATFRTLIEGDEHVASDEPSGRR